MGKEKIHIDTPPTLERSRQVEYTIRVGQHHYPIYFQCQQPLLTDHVEAWLACALLPAMAAGHDIYINGPISKRLANTLPEIIQLYHSWQPSLYSSQVSANSTAEREAQQTGRVASFFSGGVDSFYTLFENLDEITDLIFVRGFDIRLDDDVLYHASSRAVHAVAAAFDLNVIEIKTNVRELIDPYAPWGDLGYGTPLFAIAHLLSEELDRIFVPSAFDRGNLLPSGTHPSLDPLWSSEQIEIVHHGCEATRMQKVERIAHSDVTLNNLRVCFNKPNNSLNCGKCKKCLMTMLHLHIHGRLEHSTSFPTKIDPDVIRNIRDPKAPATYIFYREILEALAKRPQDRELIDAIRHYLSRSDTGDTGSRLRRIFREFERAIRHRVKRRYR